MQRPSLGRIVIVPVTPQENNEATLAPAVITRVWSNEMINVRVLVDGSQVLWKTSVRLFPDADSMWDTHTSQDASQPPHAAYWPSRV